MVASLVGFLQPYLAKIDEEMNEKMEKEINY
jgi:hypothetical protein